jgi:hypothetical protein
MIRKRPEKETDPAKYPGQIVNRPSHFEKPLVKEVEEYKEGWSDDDSAAKFFGLPGLTIKKVVDKSP